MMTISMSKDLAGRAAIPAAAFAVLAILALVMLFVPVALKLAGCMILGLIAAASWVGYRQNRRVNAEWPYNIAFLVASSCGILGLVASMVG